MPTPTRHVVLGSWTSHVAPPCSASAAQSRAAGAAGCVRRAAGRPVDPGRRCHCGMEGNNNEESSWSSAVIYIYIYPSIYIYYIHICIYVHMHIVSYVYVCIYIYIHMHKYMFYQCIMYVQYIYMYTIKLYNIHRFWISALYIQYNIHNTQCTVHSTEYTRCNTQCAMCKTRHHIKYVHPDDIAMILGYSAPILGWYSHGRIYA